MSISLQSGYFRLLQVTSGYFRLLQVTSGYFRLLQVTSGYFRLLQVTSGYFRLLQVTSGYFPELTRPKTISSFANLGSKAAGRLSSVYDARYIIVALAAALLLAACGGGGSSGGGSSVAPPLSDEQLQQKAVEFVGLIGQGKKGEMDDPDRGILFNITYSGFSVHSDVYFKQKENNIISVSVFTLDGSMRGSGDLKLEFDPAYKVGAFTNLFRLFYAPDSLMITSPPVGRPPNGKNYEDNAKDNPAEEFARGLALPDGSFVVALKEGPTSNSGSDYAHFVGIHGEEKFDIERIDDINSASDDVRKEFINFWQANANDGFSYGCGEKDCDKAHSVGYTSKGSEDYDRTKGYYAPGAVPFDDFRMQVKLIKPAGLPDRLEEDSPVPPVPVTLDDHYFQLTSWYLTDTVNSENYREKFGSPWQPGLSLRNLILSGKLPVDSKKLFISSPSDAPSDAWVNYFQMRFFENPIKGNPPYLAGGYSLITSKGGEAKLADRNATPSDADYEAEGEYYWGVFVLEQN